MKIDILLEDGMAVPSNEFYQIALDRACSHKNPEQTSAYLCAMLCKAILYYQRTYGVPKAINFEDLIETNSL